MRHQVKKHRLARPVGPRKLLVGNLVTSLIIHGKIQTTKARAKAIQPIVDKIIGVAKNKDKKTAIRETSAVLQNELSSKILFEELVKKYQSRETGFTKIREIGFRAGDTAPLVQIELL
jgi:large subunit ribosomal protein L17